MFLQNNNKNIKTPKLKPLRKYNEYLIENKFYIINKTIIWIDDDIIINFLT